MKQQDVWLDIFRTIRDIQEDIATEIQSLDCELYNLYNLDKTLNVSERQRVTDIKLEIIAKQNSSSEINLTEFETNFIVDNIPSEFVDRFNDFNIISNNTNLDGTKHRLIISCIPTVAKP